MFFKNPNKPTEEEFNNVYTSLLANNNNKLNKSNIYPCIKNKYDILCTESQQSPADFAFKHNYWLAWPTLKTKELISSIPAGVFASLCHIPYFRPIFFAAVILSLLLLPSIILLPITFVVNHFQMSLLLGTFLFLALLLDEFVSREQAEIKNQQLPQYETLLSMFEKYKPNAVVNVTEINFNIV